MQNRSLTNVSISEIEIKHLLKYFPNGVCAFDLEMTGLSPLIDRVIEIAAVKISASGEIKTFHSLVNPLIEIPEHTIQYHQLNNDDVRSAPTLKNPLKEFLYFMGNLPVIAHNAMFDISFIVMGMNQFNLEFSKSDVFDSCKFTRALYRKNSKLMHVPKDYKLATLASFYKLSFDHHIALDDAFISLKIMAQNFIAINEHPKINIKELGFLFKLNSFKKAADYILPNKLKEIKEHVQTQSEIEIKYKGGSMKGEFRPVKPLSLLALPQGIVLYALCLKSDYNKYFQIKKIQSFKPHVTV